MAGEVEDRHVAGRGFGDQLFDRAKDGATRRSRVVEFREVGVDELETRNEDFP